MDFVDRALNEQIKKQKWSDEQKIAFLNIIAIFKKLDTKLSRTNQYNKYTAIHRLEMHFFRIFDFCLELKKSPKEVNDLILQTKSCDVDKNVNNWTINLDDHKDDFKKNLDVYLRS
jgi:hypothetical protein